jgi:hypothetical protein
MNRPRVPDGLRAAEDELEAALAAFSDELNRLLNVGEHRQASELVAAVAARFAIETAKRRSRSDAPALTVEPAREGDRGGAAGGTARQ